MIRRMDDPVSPDEWLTPRLLDLLVQAERAGIARDIAVAVIIDLMQGPQFAGPQAAATDD